MLEAHLERLGLGGALGEVVAQLDDLGVEHAQRVLALAQPLLGAVQLGLQLGVGLLERYRGDIGEIKLKYR